MTRHRLSAARASCGRLGLLVASLLLLGVPRERGAHGSQAPGRGALQGAGPAGAGGGGSEGGDGADLAVMVTRQGAMMRARFEGRRLVARDAAGGIVAARELAAPERQQLVDTARAALTDDAPQWSCPVDETFVAATVDGRTLSSAVCPEKNHWRSHPELWRRLLTLVRRLLGAAS